MYSPNGEHGHHVPRFNANMKANIEKKLAKKMKALRGNLSQREFGKKLGIDHATVNRIENCSSNITLSTMEIICTRLRCNVGFIFGEED